MQGKIAQIVRYPVKSMRGEHLATSELTRYGLAFDRLYAFESDAAPPSMLRLAGRERRELLRFAARHSPDGVEVTTPDGKKLAIDSCKLPAELPGFSPTTLTHSATPQTDCRPLSLIGLQTIAQISEELGCSLDPRRFRANLYLDLPDPFAEDVLVGKTVHLGPVAVIHVLERDPRCRFITLDPITTEPFPELMKMLHQRHQGRAGVYARIVIPGPVQVGDPLWIV